jgi:hypothetical protein
MADRKKDDRKFIRRRRFLFFCTSYPVPFAVGTAYLPKETQPNTLFSSIVPYGCSEPVLAKLYAFDIKTAQKSRFCFENKWRKNGVFCFFFTGHMLVIAPIGDANRVILHKKKRRRRERQNVPGMQRNEYGAKSSSNKTRSEKQAPERKEKKRKEKKDRKSSVGRARAPTYLPAWVPDVRLRHDVIPDQPV